MYIYIDIEGSKMPGHKPSQMVTHSGGTADFIEHNWVDHEIVPYERKIHPSKFRIFFVTTPTHWNGMNGMEDHGGSGPWRSHSADICCPAGRGP